MALETATVRTKAVVVDAPAATLRGSVSRSLARSVSFTTPVARASSARLCAVVALHYGLALDCALAVVFGLALGLGLALALVLVLDLALVLVLNLDPEIADSVTTASVTAIAAVAAAAAACSVSLVDHVTVTESLSLCGFLDCMH
ncbi:hypothetical protein PINS_up014059 [Pythium insidiosum]|nr:hypothetical protein PINS_up014059 [Pythium insidiosum]